jgi:hypothetical protein
VVSIKIMAFWGVTACTRGTSAVESSSTFMMGLVGPLESLVPVQQTTRRHVPEDHIRNTISCVLSLPPFRSPRLHRSTISSSSSYCGV